MKLALLFVLLVACGGPAKPAPESPAPTETTTTDPAPQGPAVAPPATALTPTAGPSAAPSVPPPAPVAAPAARPKRPAYSCFTYSQRNSTAKRTACMRTEECGPYLDQAKQVGGIIEVTGCAPVDALWCFHQAPSKTDPQGADVCQPSMDACKSERVLLVRSGTSVDSDCAPR